MQVNYEFYKMVRLIFGCVIVECILCAFAGCTGNEITQLDTTKTIWPHVDFSDETCKSLLAVTGCRHRECALCADLRETYVSLSSMGISNLPEKSTTIYLPVIVPPFFGSSALEYLLDTSPQTSTMCHLRTWQCESSWYLIHKKILTKATLWEASETNWSRVYAQYHRDQVWDNPNASILMDKAPPNIVKVQELVDCYESNGFSYKMIIMWRSPCRHDWIEPGYHSEIILFVRSSQMLQFCTCTTCASFIIYLCVSCQLKLCCSNLPPQPTTQCHTQNST